MHQLRRYLITTLALAALALTVTVSAQGAPEGTITVSVEAWMVDKYNMNELIARFQADNPGTTVNLITHEGLGAAYLTMFLEWEQTRRSTADLYFGGLVSQLAAAMIDDQLLPWDDVLTGDLAPDRWIGGFLDSAFVAGPTGSNYPTLPGLGETMNFQVNTEYLALLGRVENGVPVLPTTYEEIAELGCALAELQVGGATITGLEMEYGINFGPDTWMAAVIASEGTYLTSDGRVNWDSPAGRDWLLFQKDIVDRGCGGTGTFTDNNAARNGLIAGQVGMINASNSRSTEANRVLGDHTAQMFGYPGTGGTLAFSHQIYIPRVAANPELARAFAIQAILSEFGQTWSADHWGKQPTIWANYDALDPDHPNHARVRVELEGPTLGQWRFRDGQTLRRAYVDELQAFLLGDQSVDEMIRYLHEAQDGADLTVPGGN